MAELTAEQVRTALTHHATRDAGGLWTFHGGAPTYVRRTEESALAITRACLVLGLPVTDTLTGEAWARLVDTVADLRQRLSRIERNPSTLMVQGLSDARREGRVS